MSAPVSDHELLELSAKAVGIKLDYRHGSDSFYYDDPETGREEWYPLGNDGQALRLAVNLAVPGRVICLSIGKDRTGCEFNFVSDTDTGAATRRAIVIAAANIGRGLAPQPAVVGESEGETCNRDGCEGVIDFTPVDNCSCHLSAPCSDHMSIRPHCPECNWDIADEPNN